MPLYNTATAAAALEVTPKWLDNLLSHNKIEGVVGSRQGVSRKLSLPAIQLVAAVRNLSSTLGLSVASALTIARQLLHEPGRSYAVSPFITLSLDVPALTSSVASRLAHAVEMAPHPQRGRPRKSP